MKPTASLASRSTLVAVVALALAALATSAGADSGEVEYSCRFDLNTLEDGGDGEGTATASFDTPIADGLTVDIGEPVTLGPLTGTITLPDEFTDLVRGSPLFGEVYLPVRVDETDDQFFTVLGFAPTEIPAEGSMTLDVEGPVFRNDPDDELGWFRPEQAGMYTIVGNGFSTGLDIPGSPPLSMNCEPVNADVIIDTFEAVGVAGPTTSAPPTTTPVRPVLVQTDFAEDDAGVAPLLGAGALMALVAGAVGVARRRERTASRQH